MNWCYKVRECWWWETEVTSDSQVVGRRGRGSQSQMEEFSWCPAKKKTKKKQETEIVRLKTNKLTTAQHRKLCHTHDTLWTLSNKNSVTKRMMNLKEKWNVGESEDKVTSHWGRSEINSFQKTSETFTESCLGLIDFFFLELTYEINS